jgi:Trypsin-like peptidase domain
MVYPPPDAKWNRFTVDANAHVGLQQMFVLISVWSADDHKRRFIGTGFIIGRKGPLAVCMTASHCLVDAIREALPAGYQVFDVDGRLRERAIAKAQTSDRICLSTGGERDVSCPLHTLVTVPGFDLAMFVITLPEPMRNAASLPACYFDSDIHPVGTHIAAFGLGKEPIEGEGREKSVMDERTRIPIRLVEGDVVALPDKSTHLSVTNYTTTIPFSHGMSGGPVFISGAGEGPFPCIAIGVVSHGMSGEVAMNESADSTVAPIVGAYVPLLATPDGSTDLKQLIAGGWTQDFGKNRDRILVKRDLQERKSDLFILASAPTEKPSDDTRNTG